MIKVTRLDLFMQERLDRMIDMLRIQYNIIIYNKMEPFVSPLDNKIIFCYAVKWCNVRDGWNGRRYIGKSGYTSDIILAKGTAIIKAIDFLVTEKVKESVILRYERENLIHLLEAYEQEKAQL